MLKVPRLKALTSKKPRAPRKRDRLKLEPLEPNPSTTQPSKGSSTTLLLRKDEILVLRTIKDGALLTFDSRFMEETQ